MKMVGMAEPEKIAARAGWAKSSPIKHVPSL